MSQSPDFVWHDTLERREIEQTGVAQVGDISVLDNANEQDQIGGEGCEEGVCKEQGREGVENDVGGEEVDDQTVEVDVKRISHGENLTGRETIAARIEEDPTDHQGKDEQRATVEHDVGDDEHGADEGDAVDNGQEKDNEGDTRGEGSVAAVPLLGEL